jgi:MPBQ/MSBQ methyltransferase
MRKALMTTPPKPVVVNYGGLDLELFFVTEVLKLRSLHYGYFSPAAPRPITLDAIRDAQAKYTEQLIGHVPDGVSTVLDVGAGIGDNARAFADRGYTVTAISPDENHAKYFDTPGDQRVTFLKSKYEDLDIDRRFDLILFSESLNYFNREIGLGQSRRYVRPGGALLIAAMFRNEDWSPFPPDYGLKRLPFVTQAREFGFDLEFAQDITEATVPTMEAVNLAIAERLRPLIAMGQHFIQASAPWKAWAIRFAFRKQIKELEQLLAYYETRTHPDTFRWVYRYAILRLRDTRPRDA